MSVSELGHEYDWVQTCVLRQSVRNQFKSLTKSAANIAVRSKDFAWVLLKLVSHFHFHTGTAWDQRSLLDESSDDAKSIMKRSFGFFENKLVRGAEEYWDGLSFVGAASNLNDFAWTTTSGFFNDKLGLSELISSEVINVSTGSSFNSATNEVNLVTFDVFNNHNLFLGKEVKG